MRISKLTGIGVLLATLLISPLTPTTPSALAVDAEGTPPATGPTETPAPTEPPEPIPAPATILEPSPGPARTTKPSDADRTPEPPAGASKPTGEPEVRNATMGQGLARIAETGDPQVPGAAESRTTALGISPVDPGGSAGSAAVNYWNPGGVLGVDVSSHQGRDVDWASAWRSGSRFAYVKATENTEYVNPYFSDQYSGAEAAGMYRGAYHFALPSLSSGSAQATFFARNGGGWTPDGKTMPPLLDVEFNPYPSLGNTCYNMTPGQMVSWISDFSRQMLAITGIKPMIYTTASWWNQCTGNSTAFSDHALHVARYGTTTPGAMPSGWGEQRVWQYTDSGPVIGDWNQWNGDLASLHRFVTNRTAQPSVARSAIDRAAAASRGLGSATSDVVCGLRNNGCYQAFQNGEVLWSPASGAVATRGGAIRDAYRASGAENGPLGYPVSGEMCGLRNGGCYQSFQNGEILWSPASGAVVTRGGAIRDAYRASGAENGPLGYPVSGEMCGLTANGCYQSFQNGEVLWSPASGAVVTRGGAIRDAYRASGAENGPLGYPVSGEMCGLTANGCYQSFQNGEILWSPASGAVVTRGGAIRDAYRRAGAENGPLGYPVSGEMCGLRDGGCYQSFRRGEILWSPSTGARLSTPGAIRDAYRASGAENGPLGYPTGSETCGARDKGCYQTFQRGEILWSPSTGARLSTLGAIRDAYRRAGAENGQLGYPIGNETCGTRDKGCYQIFQRGTLTWTPTTGVKKT